MSRGNHCSQSDIHPSWTVLHSHHPHWPGAIELETKDSGRCKLLSDPTAVNADSTRDVSSLGFQAACFTALGFIFMIMSVTFIGLEWMSGEKRNIGGHWSVPAAPQQPTAAPLLQQQVEASFHLPLAARGYCWTVLINHNDNHSSTGMRGAPSWPVTHPGQHMHHPPQVVFFDLHNVGVCPNGD